jgi:hypothetical protein
MAKPTLALIPASQGSKVFSVLPSSGVGDFDFSRGSAATRINSLGLIENVLSGQSRLEYPMIDGVVSGCPSLLLEPSRTNLVTYSEDFSDASWIKTRSSISGNLAISPDGALNAGKLIETTDTGLHAVSKTFTVVSGVSHTVSVFIKKGTNKFVQILFGTNNVTNNPYVNFDVNQGVFENNGTTSVDIKYFGNGWYRCSATVTTASTSLTYFISPIQSISDSRASSFTGSVNNNIYIYGAQLEQGSYPTSYIPTNGAAVTRAAETANGAGDASTFNDSEGVLMAEISSLVLVDTVRLISLNDGSSNNEIFIGLRSDTGNIYYNIDTNGSTQSSFISNVNPFNSFCKICIKYKENDIKFFVNGFKLHSDTSAIMPNNLNGIDMKRGNNSLPFYGKTKQIQYFQTALTDSELEILTSWVSFTEMAQGQLYTIE